MEPVFELLELNFDVFWEILGVSISVSVDGLQKISYHRYRIPGIPFVFKNKSMWIQAEICKLSGRINSFLRGFLQLSHDCGRSSRIQFDGNASCH